MGEYNTQSIIINTAENNNISNLLNTPPLLVVYSLDMEVPMQTRKIQSQPPAVVAKC